MTAATMTAQEKRMAVVETSTCYMRIAPDYESALETQELMGTVVEIVGEQGYWREIVSPQPYKAWTTEKTLVEMTGEEMDEYKKAPKYIFTELYGHIYTKPSEKSQTICDLVGGDVMRMALKGGRADKAVRTEPRAVTKGKWAQVVLPSGRQHSRRWCQVWPSASHTGSDPITAHWRQVAVCCIQRAALSLSRRVSSSGDMVKPVAHISGRM